MIIIVYLAFQNFCSKTNQNIFHLSFTNFRRNRLLSKYLNYFRTPRQILFLHGCCISIFRSQHLKGETSPFYFPILGKEWYFQRRK